MPTEAAIKILHVGDVHLDSAFSLSDREDGESRRRELRSVFGDVLQYVRKNRVDIVLIPGDLFDTPHPTRETVSFLLREMESLSFCRFFLAPGNHDPLTPTSVYATWTLPSNVHVFREETLSHVDLPELAVRVYGWAFTSPSHTEPPLAGARAEDGACLKLICGHADVDRPLSTYAPVTHRELAAFGADYAAFSHRHVPDTPCRAGTCLYAYSGFLESRSFDEPGMGGAWLLLAARGEDGIKLSEPKRLHFGQRRHEVLHLNITGADSAEAVWGRIASDAAALAAKHPNLSLRVCLEGAVSPDFSAEPLRRRRVEGVTLELRDDTVPTYASEQLEKDMTVRGELYRYLLPRLTGEDLHDRMIAKTALQLGLSALEDRELCLPTEDGK